VLSQISYITSGLALLEDEQKFSLGDVLVLIKCRLFCLALRTSNKLSGTVARDNCARLVFLF
jgi:hypothetical protein